METFGVYNLQILGRSKEARLQTSPAAVETFGVYNLQILGRSKEARLQTSPAAVEAFGVYNLQKPHLNSYIELTFYKDGSLGRHRDLPRQMYVSRSGIALP